MSTKRARPADYDGWHIVKGHVVIVTNHVVVLILNRDCKPCRAVRYVDGAFYKEYIHLRYNTMRTLMVQHKLWFEEI